MRSVAQIKLPEKVLFLDHDETMAISEKKSDGEYVIQPDGSINATIMDAKKLKRVIALSILFQIPIHVVTARADIPGDRKVIEDIINSVDGFYEGLGGFKREHIHFASTKENGIWKRIFTKEEIIEGVHRTEYPHLSRDAILFVDDMEKYLEGVRKAGYLTFQADPITREHFDLIEEFMLSDERYQPVLFKKLVAALPSEPAYKHVDRNEAVGSRGFGKAS